MTEELDPSRPIEGSAYRLAHTLPRTLYDALYKMNGSRPVKQILGEDFVAAVTSVKNDELDAYQRVIEPESTKTTCSLLWPCLWTIMPGSHLA